MTERQEPYRLPDRNPAEEEPETYSDPDLGEGEPIEDEDDPWLDEEDEDWDDDEEDEDLGPPEDWDDED